MGKGILIACLEVFNCNFGSFPRKHHDGLYSNYAAMFNLEISQVKLKGGVSSWQSCRETAFNWNSGVPFLAKLEHSRFP